MRNTQMLIRDMNRMVRKFRNIEKMHSQEETPKMGSLNPEIQRIASELLANLIENDNSFSPEEKEEKAIKNALIIRKSFGTLFF